MSDEFIVTGRDLRVGMGIGGWNMEWTLTHVRSGLTLVYQTQGQQPRHHKIFEDAKTMLRLLAETHYPWTLDTESRKPRLPSIASGVD